MIGNEKKNIVLLLLGFFLLMGSYIGYKVCILYKYSIEKSSAEIYFEFVKKLKPINKITININETVDDYLDLNGIKIKNDFDSFIMLNESASIEDGIKYMLYDENKKMIASFWIEISESYISLMKDDDYLFEGDDEIPSNINLSKMLNNVNSDIELFNFFANYSILNNNIFKSIRKIKENYVAQYIGIFILPKIESLTEITGDYTGYIFNEENYKQVSILENNKRYVFTFFNTDYFSSDYIEELLETIVIE